MTMISETHPVPFDESGEPIVHQLPTYNPEEHKGTDYSMNALYARLYHEEVAAVALLRLRHRDGADPTKEQ